MNKVLKDALDPVISDYNEGFKAWVKDPSVKPPKPDEERNRCISIITGRMEALRRTSIQPPEAKNEGKQAVVPAALGV